MPFKFTGKIAKVTIDLKGMSNADRDDTQKAMDTGELKKALSD